MVKEGKVATLRLVRSLADAMYSPAKAILEQRLSHLVKETIEHTAKTTIVWLDVVGLWPCCPYWEPPLHYIWLITTCIEHNMNIAKSKY